MGGHLVVSLDFELHWGVRDHTRVEGYRAHLLGVRQAIPRLLSVFRARNIRATWATVGMLLANDRDELLETAPRTRPAYRDPRLDPYVEPSLGRSEDDDPFHYAGSLVDAILATPGQELATHTYGHYYPLEDGAGLDSFAADLQAARTIMARRGVEPRSIVFPRNQYTPDHVRALPGLGIVAFRGHGRGRFQRPRKAQDEHLARRAARLLDAYVPLVDDASRPVRWPDAPVVDVPASRFLRPWSARLAGLDSLRLERIRRSMTAAATEGADYHLWWHPHNFGANLNENLGVLERILDHHAVLSQRLGQRSSTMAERASALGVA